MVGSVISCLTPYVLSALMLAALGGGLQAGVFYKNNIGIQKYWTLLTGLGAAIGTIMAFACLFILAWRGHDIPLWHAIFPFSLIGIITSLAQVRMIHPSSTSFYLLFASLSSLLGSILGGFVSYLVMLTDDPNRCPGALNTTLFLALAMYILVCILVYLIGTSFTLSVITRKAI